MAANKIDEMLSDRDGMLFVENVSCGNLVAEFGTPLYVISEDQVRRNLSRIQAAFAAPWRGAGVRLLPSVKACFNLAIIRILALQGTGCDTFGPGELHAALRCGILPERISVNGTGKDLTLVREAVRAGARITLDSAAELALVTAVAEEYGRVADVRLRLRPEYSDLVEVSEFGTGPSIQDVANSYKPGIPLDQVADVGAQALSSPHVRLRGLMAHMGRHRTEVEVWRKMARSFGCMAGNLCRQWGNWTPAELDIGGGFGSPRDPTSLEQVPAPPIEDVAVAMTEALIGELDKAQVRINDMILEVEPGRSLYANTGVHLTSVRHVKLQVLPSPRRWVETDTSEIFMPDLFAEHATFQHRLANNTGAKSAGVADIVGISCNFDVLAQGVECPDVKPGDVIAFLDTGAYQDAGASNFNAMPRPGVVLVSGDQVEWIKRPERLEDVFSRDILPKRLSI